MLIDVPTAPTTALALSDDPLLSTTFSFCHPACPGVPWERARISYFTALTSNHLCGSP
jgi:hypothetical protein